MSPSELPIPGPAVDDDRARELLRVWAAGGKQHVTIETGIWPDPAAWGILLVDLTKHIANAYELAGAMEASKALARVRAGFDAEWAVATNTPKGNLTGSE